MHTNTLPPMNGQATLTRGIVKRAVQLVVSMLMQAAILFISAGRLDWVMAWVYLGFYAVMIGINAAILLRKDPALIAERAEMKKDAKRWDKPLAAIVSLVGPLTLLLVAGLDVRFGWTPALSWLFQMMMFIVMALGYALSSWAIVSNKFFSGLVRIQKERGHTVATAGPYRYVRHPAYSGWLLAYLTMPLVLGSWWAIVPAGLTAIAMVVRTALEDKTLQAELEGYQEYTRQVRYRLLPGVW
jgi:protein-S-isoprenylcysteine O-methyltransferase Ste14